MLLNDSTEKTARIPVKFIDGKFINQITGEEVKEIENESFGEIVVEAHKVIDSDLLESLMNEDVIELLPMEASLLVSINAEHIPENLKRFAIGQNEKEKWVKIILLTPLLLKFRGTKQPTLLDCQCEIPSLKETDENYEPAKSLNHAYRLISTFFEPHRRSFGGSVFLKINVPPQNEIEVETKLGNLRDAKVSEYFEILKENYQKQITAKKQNSFKNDSPKQIPINKIRLRGSETKENTSWLDAKIDEKGDLVLSGYDVGEAAEMFWGDSDYEYWLTVDKQFKDSILLLLIKDRFNSDTKFKVWLEENDIPNDFDSWI